MRRHSGQSFLLIERIQSLLLRSATAQQIVFTIAIAGLGRDLKCCRVAELAADFARVGRFKFNSLKLRSRRQKKKTQSKKAKPSRVVNLKASSIGRAKQRAQDSFSRARSQAVRTINAAEKAMKKIGVERVDRPLSLVRQYFVYLRPSSAQQNRQKSHLSCRAKRKAACGAGERGWMKSGERSGIYAWKLNFRLG